MTNPSFIYGTAWKESDTARCVREALGAGFRAIDTANQRKHYFEAAVGEALREALSGGEIKREDLFIQTKYTFISGQDSRLPYNPKADISTQVLESFQSSLEHLGISYLDSYILHGPSLANGLGNKDWEAWQAMENLKKTGKTKAIGISNVSREQLEKLFAESSIKPAFVQNRCYASTGWDREVRIFCLENKIVYQGFSLLTANTAIVRDPAFQEMVKRYGCTPAQLVFSYSIAVGMLPLTGTKNPAHMREDLEALKIKLSPDDVSFLSGG